MVLVLIHWTLERPMLSAAVPVSASGLTNVRYVAAGVGPVIVTLGGVHVDDSLETLKV